MPKPKKGFQSLETLTAIKRPRQDAHLGPEQIFMFRHATDMRKSFHGLAAIVTQNMQMNVLNGDIYIFISKRRNAVKLQRFEGDRFAIFYMHLERGTFELPISTVESDTITTTCDELTFILKGVALKRIKYRPRYSHSERNY